MLIHKLQQKLLARAENNNLRTLSLSKNLLDFYSNDYLGLSKNKQLIQEIQVAYAAEKNSQNGSTGSRLLSGNSAYIEQLEQALANRFRAEKALIMNSGYNANLALLSSLPQKGDTILYDELIHASLKDGYRLSFATRFPFGHNDMEDLERKLTKAKGTIFIVIESIYSMDGDYAPLIELVALCKRFGAHIILDEAHSTGIYGDGGCGLACHLGLEREIFARVHTFGKAMGVHGACVVGPKLLMDYLINFARPFIYTTALPLHSLVSIRCAFNHLDTSLELQETLKKKIALFKQLIKKSLLNSTAYIESESPIQVIKLNDPSAVKESCLQLKAASLDVRPILSPTVKEGEERIRICLHVSNSDEEIIKLTEVLNTLL